MYDIWFFLKNFLRPKTIFLKQFKSKIGEK